MTTGRINQNAIEAPRRHFKATGSNFRFFRLPFLIVAAVSLQISLWGRRRPQKVASSLVSQSVVIERTAGAVETERALRLVRSLSRPGPLGSILLR